tara:strand:- start:188 stop:637 length:450 start_codon:yes stop_codon:yes gene_type:complete
MKPTPSEVTRGHKQANDPNTDTFALLELRSATADPQLKKFVGKTVTVAMSAKAYDRNSGFHTQISVEGKLEFVDADNSATGSDIFRVLVDKSTYTYFTAKDVYGIINSDMRTCIYLYFMPEHIPTYHRLMTLEATKRSKLSDDTIAQQQ